MGIAALNPSYVRTHATTRLYICVGWVEGGIRTEPGDMREFAISPALLQTGRPLQPVLNGIVLTTPPAE